MTSVTHPPEEGRGLLAPMTALPQENDVDRDDPRRVEIRAWLEQHPHPSGRGANAEEQLLIDDELSRANVARPINPIGIGWAGPTILQAGTAEQQQRWLPKLLSGEEFWCQLFSEPNRSEEHTSELQ